MKEPDYEQLTWFQEDFPANRFPWLESKKVKKTTVTSGRKCSELSENLRRIGLSVRTYLESCELPGERWSRIWSVKDMTSQCLILKLRLSEPRTDENESSLWPTPTAGRATQEMSPSQEKRHSRNLAQTVQIKLGLWPTPKATDYKGSGPAGSKSAEHDLKHRNLKGVVMYATPNARDYRNATAKEWDNPKNTRNLNRQIAKLYEGGTSVEERNGQLNPTWVEWLMGFPIEWTDLNASETQ